MGPTDSVDPILWKTLRKSKEGNELKADCVSLRMVSKWISFIAVGCWAASAPAKPTIGLETFDQMLRVINRPERRLSQEEADRYLTPGRIPPTAAVQPWSYSELNRLSTKPSEALARAILAKPNNSPWETFELYVRKDPSVVRSMVQAAESGHGAAVLVIYRTLGSKANYVLARLAGDRETESKAVAGVLLGMQGDKKGIEGMRFAAAKHPHWLDSYTTTRLVEWGDKNDLNQLRIYFGNRFKHPSVGLLRKLRTKACLDMMFELAKKRFRYAEVVNEVSLIRDKRTRGVMREAVLSNNDSIREQAASWFALLGNASDVPTLKRALATPILGVTGRVEGQPMSDAAVRRAIARLTPPKK